jgi:hypothetical protein
LSESRFGGGNAGARGADGGAGDGAPIANAEVTIVDANGTQVTTTTDASGVYHVRIDSMVPPFVAKVKKPNGLYWYSPSTDVPVTRGFININLTGLTDQIASDVAIAAGGSCSADLSPTMLANNASALSAAKSKLLIILTTSLTAAGVNVSVFDPVTTPLVTNSTGYDAVLDQLTVTNSTSTPTNILAKVKSADQLAYETFRNPGPSSHLFWSFPSTGAAVSGTSYFYSQSATLSGSPINGPLALTQTGSANLANIIPLPAFATTPNRIIVNGNVVVESNISDVISYQSNGVTDTLFDLTNTVQTRVFQYSNFTDTALSGALSGSPAELISYFSPLFSNSNLLNTSVIWQAGSKYERRTGVFANDTYIITDYNGTTVGTTPNPVASGTTIANLMAAGGVSANDNGTTVIYTSSMGTVSTVNGVKTYISNAIVANGGANTRYRTFYEIGGSVYIGSLRKAGAPDDFAGYSLRLNAAALATIKSALLF